MRFSLFLGFSAAAFSLVACGGKVIFGSDGSGGSGGSTAFTTSSKSVTTSSKASVTVGQSVSSSTGINPGLCDDFCKVAGQCQGGASCVPNCNQILSTPGCGAEAAAIIQCATSHIDPNCNLTGCQAELQAFNNCQTQPPPPGCTQNGCMGDSQKCACQGQCFGQPVVAQCVLLPSPMCQCIMGGQVIGTCTQPSGNACDINQGCCAQFFGPQPG